MLSLQYKGSLACKFGVVRRPVVRGKIPARESGVLVERESLIVGVRARRVEEKQAKRVAWPAVVVQKALQAGFFDQGLFVSGGGRGRGAIGRITQACVVGLGTPQNRIDERRIGGAKIQRRQRTAVGRLHQRLVFQRGEQQFVGVVA